LAEVLNSDGRFWATDKLILAYLVGTGALVAVYWNRLPEAPEVLALHVSPEYFRYLRQKLERIAPTRTCATAQSRSGIFVLLGVMEHCR
jgi:hypothetical protein